MKNDNSKAGSRPTYATSVVTVLRTVESAESAKAAEGEKRVSDPTPEKANAVLNASEASDEPKNN
jgi:hypothetical protein